LHISGDDDLQSQIRSLCEEFRDIFSNELPPTPASVPPFHLVVNDSKWESNRNRCPPRPQTTANNADIVRQIAILESQGIIEKSKTVFYSQVLMVPKPDGSRRLCVDYSPLNFCTPNPSWPLRDISESFNRIGAQNTTEAELVALSDSANQGLFLRNFLRHQGCEMGPVILIGRLLVWWRGADQKRRRQDTY
jgi:hypothetical protein